jgi:hypothetical protein
MGFGACKVTTPPNHPNEGKNSQPLTVAEEAKRLSDYEVTWAMIYQATSHADALRQALASLQTVTSEIGEGPNLFGVRKVVHDEEQVQFIGTDEVLTVEGYPIDDE